MMKPITFLLALLLSVTSASAQQVNSQDVLSTAQKVNTYFMNNYADPTILFVSALALFQILISSFSSFFILFFYQRINGKRYLIPSLKLQPRAEFYIIFEKHF